MLTSILRSALVGSACLAAALLLTTPETGHAAPAPAATAMLFDASHLANLKKGDELTYHFERKGSEQKVLGENFTDDIHVGIIEEEAGGTRAVSVRVFTTDRARPEQRISGMTGNPLLVVFLDRAVNNFAMLAGGSRPYLKNRFKQQLDGGTTVEPVAIDYKGRKVEGYRVKLTPYAGDPNALKMQGYDGSSFEIVVSDQIPGHFAETRSVYASPQELSPRLEERIVLDGVGAIK
ncbi:MAG: hypothetical protein JNM89_07505 [Hyphomicrobiaceae bacterium]|nr:hypothetical protein [Hyphomicrobiaceae bacterium]